MQADRDFDGREDTDCSLISSKAAKNAVQRLWQRFMYAQVAATFFSASGAPIRPENSGERFLPPLNAPEGIQQM